jgi:hypothetical protein
LNTVTGARPFGEKFAAETIMTLAETRASKARREMKNAMSLSNKASVFPARRFIADPLRV